MANYAPELLAELLGRLPTGTTATFTLYNGKTVKGEARDYPRGSGRRWTVDWAEWFIDAAALENIIAVTIDGPVELRVGE